MMSIDQSDLSFGAADIPGMENIPGAEETPSTLPESGLGAARAPRPAGGRDEAAGIAREARVRIGRNLRLLYAEVLEQPLPERFDVLLAELTARNDTGGSS